MQEEETMALEPQYLDIGVQNTYVFSFCLFLDKFTSTINVCVVTSGKGCLEKWDPERPGNMQRL